MATEKETQTDVSATPKQDDAADGEGTQVGTKGTELARLLLRSKAHLIWSPSCSQTHHNTANGTTSTSTKDNDDCDDALSRSPAGAIDSRTPVVCTKDTANIHTSTECMYVLYVHTLARCATLWYFT